MRFYSYVTEDPKAPNLSDDPIGTMGKTIDRDLRTLRGVVKRCRKAWPGRCFKVFSFTNVYDDNTFKLLHIEIP